MGGGFRDGGDGYGHYGRNGRPRNLGQGEGGQSEDAAVAQLPGGSRQSLRRQGAEQAVFGSAHKVDY